MKKFAIFLIVSIMLIMSGCQGKNITQNESAIGSVQTGSNTAINTTPSNTSDNTEGANNENSKTTSSSNEQNNSTTVTNSTAKAENKKVQTSDTNTAAKPKEEQKKPEPGSFTLFISKNRSTEEILRKKIQVEDNKSLLDYLRDNVSVEDDGGFIKSIEGLESITSMKLTSDQKKAGIMGVDWFIFQNEVKTKSGAGDISPRDGDIISIDYREWTYKDLAP